MALFLKVVYKVNIYIMILKVTFLIIVELNFQAKILAMLVLIFRMLAACI